MKYMGSKRRIAKHTLPIMLLDAAIQGVTTWVEPFVGGGNMIDKVPPTFTRIGLDLNPHTVAALIAVRDLSDQLPDELSEADYKALRGTPVDPITSWLRYVAAFGGIFESGYARCTKRGDDHLGQGYRNAVKQSPNLQGVQLVYGHYLDCTAMQGCLIYCDPPYQGTTKYKTGAFDHDAFFDWCRLMAKNNIVYVSEYAAPSDFKEVWRGELTSSFSNATDLRKKAVEKLFIL